MLNASSLISVDGQQTRHRLLYEALRLFSEQGFAKTSIRAIAQAAQVNVSAISYYFGDKEGLYRAAFFETSCQENMQAMLAPFSAPELGLEAALRLYYQVMLAPLQEGAAAQQSMRLYLREMLEPTGLWQEEIAHRLRPTYEAMWRVLCRHVGVTEVDEGIRWLALAINGMPIHLQAVQEVVQTLNPELGAPEQQVLPAVEAFTAYAVALVAAEKNRREMTS